LILGFIFFKEQPDKIAFLGIVIVMLSGVILMMRNSSVQKKSARSKVKT
jgi:drug/metabolite transporter (DMT)-like permease